MHVTNDQFLSKFNNGWKKSKWLIYCHFLHFTSIIWPCWRDNMKCFSFIPLRFVMHVTNKKFSDKFLRLKKIQNGQFIVIFCILRQLSALVFSSHLKKRHQSIQIKNNDRQSDTQESDTPIEFHRASYWDPCFSVCLLIKKGGLLQLTLTFTCGHNNLEVCMYLSQICY